MLFKKDKPDTEWQKDKTEITAAISIIFASKMHVMLSFPSGSDGKASACNVEDLGSILGLGRSPGEGNGNPLQYSCLENPTDGGAW